MLAWGFNVFYFEAFDEPWKPDAIGLNGVIDDETHWGAMNADRSLKWPLNC
jgi:glucan 1,3-beta-glucosidase